LELKAHLDCVEAVNGKVHAVTGVLTEEALAALEEAESSARLRRRSEMVRPELEDRSGYDGVRTLSGRSNLFTQA
jgi:hypothetical protein